MGTLSVRLDNKTEELLKQLLSSRKVKASDLVREMIEKEAAGGLLEAVNSVQLAVDVIQDRLAELEVVTHKALGEAAFSSYLWKLAQSKKTAEEIAGVQTGFDDYVQKLMAKEG